MSAEGIVEEAATYRGKVRQVRHIRIQVRDVFGLQQSKHFKIVIGGETFEGQTSDKGVVELAVPSGATEATLNIDGKVYDLELVDDQPTDSIEWTQTRLNNLGFDCGPIDGKWGPRSQAAMKLFQQLHGLKPTGLRDKESLDLLEKVHDQEYEAVEDREEEPEEDEFSEEEQISEETGEDDYKEG